MITEQIPRIYPGIQQFRRKAERLASPADPEARPGVCGLCNSALISLAARRKCYPLVPIANVIFLSITEDPALSPSTRTLDLRHRRVASCASPRREPPRAPRGGCLATRDSARAASSRQFAIQPLLFVDPGATEPDTAIYRFIERRLVNRTRVIAGEPAVEGRGRVLVRVTDRRMDFSRRSWSGRRRLPSVIYGN